MGQVSRVMKKMSNGSSKLNWVRHAVHIAQVFHLQYETSDCNSFVLSAPSYEGTLHLQSYLDSGSAGSKAETPEPAGIDQSLVQDETCS